MVREQTGRKFKQKLYHGVLYTDLTITRNSEPITKTNPQNKTKDWLAMLANIHFPKMFLETRQCTILRNICGKRVGTHWLAIPANIHFPPMFLETWQSTMIRNICGKLSGAGWLPMSANIHFPPMFLDTCQSTIIRNIGGKLAAAG